MEYAYGYSDHRIEQPNYGPDYADAARETSKAAALVRQMSWIFDLFQSLPEWLAKALSPTFTTVIQHQQVSRQPCPLFEWLIELENISRRY